MTVKYIQDTDWWKEANRRLGAELDAKIRKNQDRIILAIFGLKPKSMLNLEDGGQGKPGGGRL